MAQSQRYLTVNPGALATTNICYILKATTGYGGLTVLGAYFTAYTAGTCNLELLNYGTAGTALISSLGTIAAAVGGTACVWAGTAPQALTVTAANAYVDEGEWIVLKRTDGVAGSLGNFCTLTLNFVEGVVSVG